ncbi:hypothetical protein ACFT9I_27080 [Streptomyces sp. NPDC057137]|uniref:hypothetical protein n=1 Tax=Streptomyces sp. NPDC057137 TaxID=3346030 RepID=UPI00364277EB
MGNRGYKLINPYGNVEYLDDLEIAKIYVERDGWRWPGGKEPRSPRRGGAGRIARGVAAAGIAGTVASAPINPEQSSTTTQRNYGQSQLNSEGTRQGSTNRGATRDKGRRTGGSGQQS